MIESTPRAARAHGDPGRAVIALGSLLAVTACVTPRSYASVVHRDLRGGVLALEGPDRAVAWRDADRMMRAQCGGDYRIIAEDRVRTGERTTSNMTAESDAMLGYDEPYPGYPLGYPPGYGLGYPPGAAMMEYPWYPPGPGIAGGEAETETTPVYERQITYRCTGQPPAQQLGSTPAPAPPSSAEATPPSSPPASPPPALPSTPPAPPSATQSRSAPAK